VVTIVVKEDPFFKREGTDIHIDVPITLSQAILGCTVDVLTLDGIVELKIPPGAQPGARLMMRSKGMRFVSDNMRRGHQYCTIKIKIPTAVSLSEQQKTLIQQFDDEEEKKKGSEAAGNNSFNTFNFESAVKRVNEFNKTKK
jgi:molecular chaperone DnaJ